ncbi:MAG: aminomethyl transferase family protein [Dehalococcoidia bacterium]|nr:aminomethyl transferase family protein [Dehalococcoidia bacterium]
MAPVKSSERSSSVDEYRAAKEGVALWDASANGRLRLQGKDALDLLHRLSSNDLLPLQPGQMAYTVLTNNKGRVLDHLKVYRLEDHLLVVTSPGNAPKVAEWIDLYTFLEESTVTDVTAEMAVFQVVGPKARALLEALTGQALEDRRVVSAFLDGKAALIARDDWLGVPGYEVVAIANDAPALWQWLLERGQPWGMQPLGREVFEALRIEAGVPLYGAELSEQVNPLEAGLRPSISFTKGCYIGQEVVLRLDTYRKLQRHLVRLEMEGEDVPPLGEKLLVDGKTVGTLTSAAQVPGESRIVALALLRTAHDKAGQQVQIASLDRRWVARVIGLEQYAREGTGR